MGNETSNLTRHRFMVGFKSVILMVLLSLATSCSKPPVLIAFRESLVGNGFVVIVTNASENKSLKHVTVKVKLPNGDERERIIALVLGPDESAEAGWLEFMNSGDESDAWAIPAGAKVSVYAHDYSRAAQGEVPELD